MSDAVTGPAVDRDSWPYRMKDLCELTGLNRQAIHFYIKEGLLPPGRKTGRNMAYYSEEHVQRLKLIRRLQHERFLPLKAIKAVLDGQSEAFSADQRAWLRRVKQRVAASLALDEEHALHVEAAPLLEAHGVSEAELTQLHELGVIGVGHDGAGRRLIPAQDTWVLEFWGAMRRLGFSRELGFGVTELGAYEESISQLFKAEVAMLAERFSRFDAERGATMIEHALPLIHEFMTRYHEAKIRQFFAAM